jgi:D-aminopeptidase
MSETRLPLRPSIGVLPGGPLGSFADVAGVTVGHCTLDDGPIQTGVTVIHSHGGDPYRSKVPAAATVINGFAKSIGLTQIEESVSSMPCGVPLRCRAATATDVFHYSTLRPISRGF